MRSFIGISALLLAGAGVSNAQEFAFSRPTPSTCSLTSLVPICAATENLEPVITERAALLPATNLFGASAFSSNSKESKAQRQEYPSRPNRTHDAFDLAVGMEYLRFRSTLYAANLVGLHTSFTYFRYAWLGFEGNVVAAFGSSSLLNESSRAVIYAGGPRIAWREKRFQPWMHALVGGIHIRPQTASSINSVAFQLGGGVDWRYKPLISFRAESDYVRSQLNSSGQNSFQFGGGVVFHF
jgi:hypothetical protein